MISLACSFVIWRGLFAKTNPKASAPYSTAACASSLLVIPQILTRIFFPDWNADFHRYCFLFAKTSEAKPQTDKRVWNHRFHRLHRLYELVFLSVQSVKFLVSVVIFKNLTQMCEDKTQINIFKSLSLIMVPCICRRDSYSTTMA